MAEKRYYLGIEARKMKPTKKHRPAIWECILGTVYAMNPEGHKKYFDYDYEAAKEFAGLTEDLRIWKNPGGVRYGKDVTIPKGKLVLWALKKEAE